MSSVTLQTLALWAMVARTSPPPFTATIDTSNMLPQNQSPLFSSIPSEIRTRIFEYACTTFDDLEKPFGEDRLYRRPGYKYNQQVGIGLLQSCKRIFQETRLMPVSETEHTFWIFGGPFRLVRVRRNHGNFEEWQESLNEAQRSAVKFVHLFIQQCRLETLEANPMSLRLNFQTKTFKITLRHSDWWSWESPVESTDRLGICPWLPGRVSQQAMLAQPLALTPQQLKAAMINGTWGWLVGQVKGLEVLRIEFETDVVKKEQLHMVLERAKHWKFLVHDAKAILETDGRVERSEWVGPANLKHDNAIYALRHVTTNTDTVAASTESTPMRTYYVAELTWRKRNLGGGSGDDDDGSA